MIELRLSYVLRFRTAGGGEAGALLAEGEKDWKNPSYKGVTAKPLVFLNQKTARIMSNRKQELLDLRKHLNADDLKSAIHDCKQIEVAAQDMRSNLEILKGRFSGEIQLGASEEVYYLNKAIYEFLTTLEERLWEMGLV